MDEFGSCLVALSEDEDVDADESLCCCWLCFPDDDEGTQLLLFFDFHNFIFYLFATLIIYLID